ncbi:hypothetical protein Gogos_016671, partial [Gossypium gossypioides]|nr:hypothetical protein [Gossypium gossypioides]
EFVKSDGSWNLDLLRVWLPKDVICRITSIPPPHLDFGSDRDLAHVLHDCPFAKDVWTLVLPEQLKQRFFSTSFPDWLLLNLCFHERLQGSGLIWPCLFGLIAWRIWKNRNLFIFQNISWTTTEVVKASSCWAQQYESQIGGCKRNNPSSNSANNLDDTWVFLSTDRAMARDSGYAATRGVSIIDGILILLNKGYRRAIILTDNLKVAQILSDLDLEDSEITVLRRTERIMRAEGMWKIKHIPRKSKLGSGSSS